MEVFSYLRNPMQSDYSFSLYSISMPILYNVIYSQAYYAIQKIYTQSFCL